MLDNRDCHCCDLHGPRVRVDNHTDNCISNLQGHHISKEKRRDHQAKRFLREHRLVRIRGNILLPLASPFPEKRPFPAKQPSHDKRNKPGGSSRLGGKRGGLEAFKALPIRLSSIDKITNVYSRHWQLSHQPEDRVHQVLTKKAGMVSYSLGLRSSILIRSDLQPIQGFLLGSIPSPLCSC